MVISCVSPGREVYMQFPNAYIVKTENPSDSFTVYGEMNEKGFAAKGYRIEVPNLKNAGNGLKNDLFVRLSGWLASQDQSKRIQIRYVRDKDYGNLLKSYEQKSECSDSEWVKYIRTEISSKNSLENGFNHLKREYIYVYLSKGLKGLEGDSFLEFRNSNFEREIVSSFASDQSNLSHFLNLPVIPLNHIELYKEFYRSVNKSAYDVELDYEKNFNPDLDAVYRAEFSGQIAESGSASFTSDGYFHNIFTLHDFPLTDMYPFYGNKLLDNDIQNLTIAVNIVPLDTEKVIEQKQRHWKRVRADLLEEEGEIAASAGLDELTEHIYRLGKGEDSPFRIEYVVHTWNKDLKALQSDGTILKQAATSMFTSLDSYELGTQALHNFMKTLPGNLFYKKPDAALDCMHRPLAAMLPFSSSFIGKGSDGNIMFNGDHGNLMTMSFFDGNTPQHTLCLGQTGAGKSVNFVSMLSQAYDDFDKIVIIEEGGSYYNLTQIYGDEAQYIVIDPSANLTLNYFDTGGLPLTPGQIEFVTTFLTAMCGASSTLEKLQDAIAILTPFVNAVYSDSYMEWRNRHREELEEAARITLTVQKMIDKLPLDQNTILDAYLVLKEILEKKDGFDDQEWEFRSWYHAFSKQEINDCIIEDPEELRNISYAFMGKGDMPYHSQLVEAVRENTFSHLERAETNRIAARLAVYSIESGKGCLFDGETSIDLSKKWIHIELGKISQSSDMLKNLVGITINNLVKNQIINMPRASRKFYLFEELARFLAMIPGSAEIVKQFYAQFRKFNCVVASITQSIAQMAESGVGQIIMTQSKMFIFLKNTDAAELKLISNYVPLSDEAKRNIMNFPSPEHLPPNDRYSSFLLYAQRADYPIIGVGRNYASPAILAAAATLGDLHGKLQRIMKRKRNIPYAQRIIEASELLYETHSTFKILNEIEDQGNQRIKDLALNLKIEIKELLKGGCITCL